MNAKENSRNSFNHQAAVYDTTRYGAHARRMYGSILERVISLQGLQKISSLLDIGCGTGEMLYLIQSRCSAMNLYGIDISEKMLDTARLKLGEKASLFWGDAENLPFDDGVFDLLICNDSFHHYPTPAKALSEFRRVLRPGGLLLISDYHVGFPLRQLMNLFIRFGHNGDVRIYSKTEIVHLLSEASFGGISYESVHTTGCMVMGSKTE